MRKTIESVVTQTQTDFEYLIIDGASTDESVNVIKEYVEHAEYGKKITYWVSEADTGIYNAMNKGIRLAKGDYLHMLNSGDWYEPNALDYILPKLQEETPDVISCSLNFWKNKIRLNTQLRYHDNLIGSAMLHQGTIYKRNIHTDLGLYDETYKYAADYDFSFKLYSLSNLKEIFLFIPVINFGLGGLGESAKSQKEANEIRVKNGFIKNKNVKKRVIFFVKLFIPYGVLLMLRKIRES